MRKYFFIGILLMLIISMPAQNIKQDKIRQAEQQQTELKKAARIKQSELNLSDLLKLLRINDVESIDNYLKIKDYQLNRTISNEYDDEGGNKVKGIVWSFYEEMEYTNYSYYSQKNFRRDVIFYLYPNQDNAIYYGITDEGILEKLKAELIKDRYKKINSSDIIKNGLRSVYRNDTYEVVFEKVTNSNYYSYNNSYQYSFFIRNYKQAEDRIKQAAEKLKREEQYQDAVERAEKAYLLKSYTCAKQAYNEAVLLKPEKRAEIQDKIAEIDICILCKEGDTYFQAKQYNKARDKYEMALQIEPNSKKNYINEKIAEIQDIDNFLLERRYKQYDYKDINYKDYQDKDRYFTEVLKKYLFTSETNIQTNIIITLTIDTLGQMGSSYTTSIQNKELEVFLKNQIDKSNLFQCFIKNYPVNAKAEFSYKISHDHTIITVSKTAKGLNSKQSDFNNFYPAISSVISNKAPFGKYVLNLNKTEINGQNFDNNTLIKMKNNDGAANALLSLLVPGLGDHRVFHTNNKRGIAIALSTYGLIGGGAYLKICSNNEYKKYLSATSQNDMDKYYENANNYNQLFYGCIIIAGAIWISDIIWVATEGAKNTKNANKIRQSFLSAYYNPHYNVTGIAYSYKF